MDVICPRCGTPSGYNPRDGTSNQRKLCTSCHCKFVVRIQERPAPAGIQQEQPVELWERLIIKQITRENMSLPAVAEFHGKDEQWIQRLVVRWARLGLVPRTVSNG